MDELEAAFTANRRYAGAFHDPDLPTRPARRLAVLCCMDSRIDVFAVLGLRNGEAHIVRNAGGLATEDAVRSLALSRWALGTDSILVIQHTRCGLHRLDQDALGERIKKESGAREIPDFGGFDDLEASVRAAVARLAGDPLFEGMSVAGAVYDVDTGRLARIG